MATTGTILRKIKRLIIVGLLFCGFTLSGALLFLHFNKQVVLDAISSQLESQGISLQASNASVVFLSTFPNASLKVNDLILAKTEANTPIITSKQVFINLNISKLVSGTILLDAIALDGAQITIKRDKNRSTNYELGTQEKPNASDLELIWQQAIGECKNCNLIWHDEYSNNIIHIEGLDLKSKPTDIPNQYNFKLDGQGKNITISDNQFIRNQEIHLKTSLHYSSSSISIETGSLECGDHEFDFTSQITGLQASNPSFLIDIQKAKGNIEKIDQYLPDQWVSTIQDHHVNGKYSLTGTIKSNTGEQPEVDIQSDLINTSIQHPTLTEKIQSGNGQLRFQWKNNNNSEISIHPFEAEVNENPVNIDFTLTNISKPKINLLCSGMLNLSDISPELIPEILLTDQGSIKLDSFAYASDNSGADYFGKLQLHNIKGLLMGIGFEVKTGTAIITPHTVSLEENRINALNEEYLISGILNLISSNYDLSVASKRLNLVHFLEEFQASSEPQVKPVNNTDEANPIVTVNLDIDQVIYNNIELSQTDAKLRYANNILNLRSQFNYCGGNVNAETSHSLNTGLTNITVESKKIDLHQTFEQWENFGQKEITTDHLQGKGDLKALIRFVYSAKNEWDASSLDMQGGLVIYDGELMQVPLLQNFNKYIKSQDLSHIKFTRLSNVFEIKDQEFHLPQMFIQSNAVNLIISGDHSFDQDINYALQINAGQTLINKLKKHDTDLNPVKARTIGMFNLHYLIRGHIDDFDYSKSKSKVLDKFERSLFKRDEILTTLKGHFEIGNEYDTPLLFQDIPEPEIDSGEEPEYLEGFK